MTDFTLEVGGDSLQAANGDGRAIQAAAAAGGLARTVAGTAQDAGEHVGFPVDHVGISVLALRDQTYVLRNISVGRTGPLAVHDLVEVIGVPDIAGLHCGGASLFLIVDPFEASGTSKVARHRELWMPLYILGSLRRAAGFELGV